MKDSLKNSIQNKFSEERLSKEQLDSLLDMQTNLASKQDKSFSSTFRLAAFFSLTAIVVFSCFLFFETLQFKRDMPFAIANEVAHNHHKLKPLEIQSSLLNDISEYFTKLDFKPVSSSLIDPTKFSLLGARYCSLQGITAAQIRYITQDGQLVTFYEVPYDESTYSSFPAIDKGEQPLESYANGVGVKIWVEKGLLMAMTF